MVARTDSTVLIQGETGTGKELLAKAIHEASFRKCRPYITVNCAAIPIGLLESDLFGHERGAFTGALTQTTGRFQHAHTGTLFLDEVGDLPLELQPKLLRVLQEREFEKVGGNRTIRVDVRIVAATNQDLHQMVRERRFRADLFYRLNVFPITLPPLRERPDDIPLLVQHFMFKYASRMSKEINGISERAMEVLRRHNWPGNVRELQNVVERAVIMSSGPNLEVPTEDLERVFSTETAARTLDEAQRDCILEALRQTRGVIAGRNGAAVRLGVARTTLISRMRKLGLGQREQAGLEPPPNGGEV
jgi:formate hydrogenlyase transcriptional activator